MSEEIKKEKSLGCPKKLSDEEAKLHKKLAQKKYRQRMQLENKHKKILELAPNELIPIIQTTNAQINEPIPIEPLPIEPIPVTTLLVPQIIEPIQNIQNSVKKIYKPLPSIPQKKTSLIVPAENKIICDESLIVKTSEYLTKFLVEISAKLLSDPVFLSELSNNHCVTQVESIKKISSNIPTLNYIFNKHLKQNDKIKVITKTLPSLNYIFSEHLNTQQITKNIPSL